MASDAWPEDIPIWIDGQQKWMTGLTRRTTCDDVIYALLYARGLLDTDSTDNYAVFERWRAVERPLQGRTKIVKVWTAWDGEQPNVQLLVQRLDDYFMPPTAESAARNRRRHRRSNRQRARHSANCRCVGRPQCARCGRLKAVEHLVKHLVKQERQLQELKWRVHDTDRQIAEHEAWQHTRRMQRDGCDYVQDSYLLHHWASDVSSTSSEDSLDCLLLAVGEDALDDYLNLCDKLYDVMSRLEHMRNRQQSLAREIEDAVLEDQMKPVPSEGERGDMDWEAQMEAMQVQLTRAAAASILKHQQEMDVIKELQLLDAKVKEKQEQTRQLQQELDNYDTRDPCGDQSLASPRLNAVSAARREERESLVSADQDDCSDRQQFSSVLSRKDSVNLKSKRGSKPCDQSNLEENSTDLGVNVASWSCAREQLPLTFKPTSTDNERIKPPVPPKPHQTLHYNHRYIVPQQSISLNETGLNEVAQLTHPAHSASSSTSMNDVACVRNESTSYPVSKSHAGAKYPLCSEQSKDRNTGRQDPVPTEHSLLRPTHVPFTNIASRPFELCSFRDDSGVCSSDSSTDSGLLFDATDPYEAVSDSSKQKSSSDPVSMLDVSLSYDDSDVQCDHDLYHDPLSHLPSSLFGSSNPHSQCFDLDLPSRMSTTVNGDAVQGVVNKDLYRNPLFCPELNKMASSDPHGPCADFKSQHSQYMELQDNHFVRRNSVDTGTLGQNGDSRTYSRETPELSESSDDLVSDTVPTIVGSTTAPTVRPVPIISTGRQKHPHGPTSSTVQRTKTVRFADEMTSWWWCDDADSSDDTGLSSLHDEDALETLV